MHAKPELNDSWSRVLTDLNLNPKEIVDSPLSTVERNVCFRGMKVTAKAIAQLSTADGFVDEFAQNDDHAITKLIGNALLDLAFEDDLKPDIKSRMLLEGKRRLNVAIKKSGGTYSKSDVVDLLGISPQAISKRVKNNSLLALKFGNHDKFPCFQFDVNGVIPGVEKLLKILSDHDPVDTFRFFTAYDEDLQKSVIECIKAGTDSELIETKARRYLEMGN